MTTRLFIASIWRAKVIPNSRGIVEIHLSFMLNSVPASSMKLFPPTPVPPNQSSGACLGNRTSKRTPRMFLVRNSKFLKLHVFFFWFFCFSFFPSRQSSTILATWLLLTNPSLLTILTTVQSARELANSLNHTEQLRFRCNLKYQELA